MTLDHLYIYYNLRKLHNFLKNYMTFKVCVNYECIIYFNSQDLLICNYEILFE